ncbi:hypothetical protein GINT2_001824 [Glugoides intestinalis]
MEENCSLLSNGIVLSKYYLKNCAACTRLTPIYEEIKSKAEKAQINIKFREIECGSCECNGISSFPTMEITRDKESMASMVGYKDYHSISDWLNTALALEGDVFGNHIEHVEGLVKALTTEDFIAGFDGQWMLLFYEDAKDVNRTIFKELAKAYKDKISIAEIDSKEAESIAARYNVTEYPTILAINHGTPVPFTGKNNFANLSAFAERLFLPAFQHITYKELKEVSREHRNGEPMFIVLYKNFELASFYFNELAQQFKFKALIYRSDDPAVFAAAGSYPKDIKEFENGPEHNQMVYLSVYKNSSFFIAQSKLDRMHELVEWIFHAHFPHVTNIDNDNFYTVFHGIKPVVLLLTSNQQYLESFNRLSATWHLGTVASNIIFATIDPIEYPMFKSQVLPKAKDPAVAFYDPVLSQWYYQPVKITEETFNKTVMKMIDLYFNKKLPVYPAKSSGYNMYAIGALVIALGVFVYKLQAIRNKVD